MHENRFWYIVGMQPVKIEIQDYKHVVQDREQILLSAHCGLRGYERSLHKMPLYEKNCIIFKTLITVFSKLQKIGQDLSLMRLS